MAKSAETSTQFNLLPKHIQDIIFNDMAQNGSADSGATPFSFVMAKNSSIPAATQGTVFKDDAADYGGTIGPLTQSDLAPELAQASAAPTGALSMTAPMQRQHEPLDFASMLAKYVPEDDSSSKYLAMAAALGRPTGFGSFGEKMSNVADALLEQKQTQQKLRSQYVPLIMQQVAAQQARDEQAAYRMEAAQQARAAQMQAAQIAQQGRTDLATQAQLAAKERADADRASKEQIAADRLEAQRIAKAESEKPPQGYSWGPKDEKGNPTLLIVKGGPADLKQTGMLNADTQALTGAVSGFDRLAAAANQVLNHPGLPGITGISGKLPNMPGGKAADAEALLGTLKSQVGFGVLQDMRNNSKTGGALGSVSDAEGKRLESNLASLEKAQSLPQFQESLRQIVDYAEKAKDRMREAYNLKHGDASTGSPASASVATPGLPTPEAIAAEIARRAAAKKGS